MNRALAMLVLTGCGVGGGTTTVGIWRPKHVVETEVCIRDRRDKCARTVEVAHDDPARSFAGFMLSWVLPGYMHLSGPDGASKLFVLDNHVEYLRGRGGAAVGLRVGYNFALGSGHSVMDLPISVLGHLGGETWSVYAGPGYTPYFSDKADNDDGVTTTTTTHQGFNLMAGGQLLLKRNRWSRLTANVALQQHFISGNIRAASASVGIGIHF